MESCPSFEGCSAPLCPLDARLQERIWYAHEPVCQGKPGAGKKWIKKQRQIKKRQYASYIDRPVSHAELFAASRPRKLSDKQRAALRKRLANIHQEQATG